MPKLTDQFLEKAMAVTITAAVSLSSVYCEYDALKKHFAGEPAKTVNSRHNDAAILGTFSLLGVAGLWYRRKYSEPKNS